VIVDPADYRPLLEEMKKSGGSVSKETNFRLAKKVYALTAKYDTAISEYLKGK
jgi:phosphoribosylaminoimidazolecarboxamide formyltransferase/IMP cyclohydrolase